MSPRVKATAFVSFPSSDSSDKRVGVGLRGRTVSTCNWWAAGGGAGRRTCPYPLRSLRPGRGRQTTDPGLSVIPFLPSVLPRKAGVTVTVFTHRGIQFKFTRGKFRTSGSIYLEVSALVQGMVLKLLVSRPLFILKIMKYSKECLLMWALSPMIHHVRN